MTQTNAGGSRDVDNNNKSDPMSRKLDCNGHFDNISLKTSLKTEQAMGVLSETTWEQTKHEKNDVSVDDLIAGVKSCNVDEDNSITTELSRVLGDLKLGDNVKQLQEPKERDSQPKEDDETQEGCSVTDGDKGDIGRKVKSVEDVAVPNNLATVLAPSFDDSEEEDECIRSTQDETEVNLEARGPMFGVPSKFATDSKALEIQSHRGNGPKRALDDTHYEPTKYVKPHESGVGEFNSLNVQGSVSEAGSVNLKTMVCLNQMAGGTVFASENASSSADQMCNGMIYIQDPYTAPKSQEFDKSILNFPEVHFDEWSGNIPERIARKELYQTPNYQRGVSICQPTGYSQQYSLPQAGTLIRSLPRQYHEYDGCPQTIQQYQSDRRDQRGSSDDNSDGYSSDSSPVFDTNSSPLASPHSLVAATSSALHGSPSRVSYSPPPSISSIDSGLCSPQSDDYIAHTSQIPCSDWHAPNDFTSSYISEHLTEYNLALEVMNEDLINDKRTRELSMTSQSNTAAAKKNTPERRIGSLSRNNQTTCSDIVSSFTPKQKDCIINRSLYGSPAISGKPEFFPSLPTTVPIMLSPSTKNISTKNISTKNISTKNISTKNMSINIPAHNIHYQQSGIVNSRSDRNNNLVKVPKSPPQAPYVITRATNPVPQLIVNPQGKIAIQPVSSKKPAQNSSPIVPLFVSPTGQVMRPVFVVQKDDSPKKRPLRAIAPKAPSKQPEKAAEAMGKPINTISSQTGNCKSGQEGISSNTPQVNGTKTREDLDTRRLNHARRVVAEMLPADLQYRDEDGDNYLHVSVCQALIFMVQALLERLAREKFSQIIDMQNSQGQSPLYLAGSINNAEMVQLLTEHGADVNLLAESETSAGVSVKQAAIHCVSSRGDKYLNTVQALLKAPGIDLNQVNSDGHTALNCAILAHGKATDNTHVNSIPIIQALIQAGADPNLQVQQSGKTAFMFALESRDLDLIESIFQLVEPSKLASVLRAQAFDGSTCHRIAESLKASLDQAGQHRLSMCLKPGTSRGGLGSSL